eukprot:Gb_04846 [translate_table: standard]
MAITIDSGDVSVWALLGFSPAEGSGGSFTGFRCHSGTACLWWSFLRSAQAVASWLLRVFAVGRLSKSYWATLAVVDFGYVPSSGFFPAVGPLMFSSVEPVSGGVGLQISFGGTGIGFPQMHFWP